MGWEQVWRLRCDDCGITIQFDDATKKPLKRVGLNVRIDDEELQKTFGWTTTVDRNLRKYFCRKCTADRKRKAKV